MSASHRRLKALGISTALAAASLVIPTISATAAHAGGCNDFSRLTSWNITTSRWGYIGYVEMDYSSACKQISGHLHLDSAFYSGGHSGWNVTVTTDNESASGTAEVTYTGSNNSDSQDFWTPIASIYGHPSETFVAAADWEYDGCKLGASTGSWDFNNGRVLTAGSQFTWSGYSC
ncbi:hypothetical protein ABZ832_17200 [Streptantibioticus parmotrematis]|uniref:hypothetical protein n=1 Tax=Streptantibioticus parmotrematis TaxID=2873249 RepID=UPI0033F84E06